MRPEQLERLRKALEDDGWVLLRRRSHHNLLTRVRVAESRAAYAEQLRAHQEKWLEETICPDIRRLTNRITHLYGLAKSLGASREDLHGAA